MKTSFKSFITEADYRRELSLTQAIEYAQRYCYEAMQNAKHKKFLFRGVRAGDESFLTIDPSVSARRSANTSNYYNLLFSNMSEWSAYPSREKSVICSSDPHYTRAFGNCYVVLPRDGAVLGECPTEDLWSSFQNTMSVFDLDDMAEFNYGLKSFIEFTLNTYSGNAHIAPDTDWSTLTRVLEHVTQLINENEDAIYADLKESSPKYPKLETFFVHEILAGQQLLQVLEKMLSPNRHEFQTQLQTEWHREKKCEIWTDSKCLLVSAEDYPDFLNKYHE